ncbi:MAG: hypothetical protein ACOX2M_03605 [Fastidiosipilaceae bacterium]
MKTKTMNYKAEANKLKNQIPARDLLESPAVGFLVESVARSVTRDQKVRVETRPKLDMCYYDPQQKRIVIDPFTLYVDGETDIGRQLVKINFLTAHEGMHYRWSGNENVEATYLGALIKHVWNILEDGRGNSWVIQEYPGLVKTGHRWAYEDMMQQAHDPDELPDYIKAINYIFHHAILKDLFGEPDIPTLDDSSVQVDWSFYERKVQESANSDIADVKLRWTVARKIVGQLSKDFKMNQESQSEQGEEMRKAYGSPAQQGENKRERQKAGSKLQMGTPQQAEGDESQGSGSGTGKDEKKQRSKSDANEEKEQQSSGSGTSTEEDEQGSESDADKEEKAQTPESEVNEEAEEHLAEQLVASLREQVAERLVHEDERADIVYDLLNNSKKSKVRINTSTYNALAQAKPEIPKEARTVANHLINQLRMMLEKEEDGRIGGQRSGRLNRRSIHKAAYSPEIFNRKMVPNEIKPFAVCIVLDKSGSMNTRSGNSGTENKMETAKAVSWIIGTVCNALQIPVAMFAYDSYIHPLVTPQRALYDVDYIYNLGAWDGTRHCAALRHLLEYRNNVFSDIPTLSFVISDDDVADAVHLTDEVKAEKKKNHEIHGILLKSEDDDSDHFEALYAPHAHVVETDIDTGLNRFQRILLNTFLRKIF